MFVKLPTTDGPLWLAVSKIVSIRAMNHTKTETILETDTREYHVRLFVEEVLKILEEKGK